MLLLLSLLTPLFVKAPPIPQNPKLSWCYAFTPQTPQEEFVFTFFQYEDIFIKYGVSIELAVTQAVAEQGWDALEHPRYRIFNLMRTSSNQQAEIVYDKYTKRYRAHRTYKNLRSAIVDYCRFLNQYDRYKKVLYKEPHFQIYLISKTGYAEATHYKNLLNTLYYEQISRIVERIRATGTFSYRGVYDSYNSRNSRANGNVCHRLQSYSRKKYEATRKARQRIAKDSFFD